MKKRIVLKKKVVSVLCMIVEIMVISFIMSYIITYYRPIGTFVRTALETPYKIYTFKNYDRVMYGFQRGSSIDLYLGENAEEGSIYSQAHIYISAWREPTLVGFTPNYLIFSVKEYRDSDSRIEIAVKTKVSIADSVAKKSHECVYYDELSFFEKLRYKEVISVEAITN